MLLKGNDSSMEAFIELRIKLLAQQRIQAILRYCWLEEPSLDARTLRQEKPQLCCSSMVEGGLAALSWCLISLARCHFCEFAVRQTRNRKKASFVADSMARKQDCVNWGTSRN